MGSCSDSHCWSGRARSPVPARAGALRHSLGTRKTKEERFTQSDGGSDSAPRSADIGVRVAVLTVTSAVAELVSLPHGKPLSPYTSRPNSTATEERPIHVPVARASRHGKDSFI
ncbi:hypothetical protein AAFF_G00214000 [Aldrovandia affinis]|uniref:Uncharacterized protein n=1 Tax=Aldrovandia affinis TaxID=143900 RepID=A0AAD7RGW3_9TELE|nr:hypothetical protein AAFF_G00214000 [Aldrovandia affinis]